MFRYLLTLDCFASRLNKQCRRYLSVAFEIEAVATNFFCQELSSEEYYWCFPHPHYTSAMIGHLHEFQARGVFLLVCLPSQVAISRVFRVGRTARFVQVITWINPTWDCGKNVESGFFRGPARQRVCLVEFDFDVEDSLSFV